MSDCCEQRLSASEFFFFDDINFQPFELEIKVCVCGYFIPGGCRAMYAGQ
jgi:hypothetical protein